eukprot:1157493-Pelagomonas_calceolata.AAC.2
MRPTDACNEWEWDRSKPAIVPASWDILTPAGAMSVRSGQAHTTGQCGTVSVGESIELPSLKLSKPVRSMQMFKRPMNKASPHSNP